MKKYLLEIVGKENIKAWNSFKKQYKKKELGNNLSVAIFSVIREKVDTWKKV